ncbi:MAG TPA: carboxypeptidase-like regulatory domain-containing protein, partial [Blastocatellia bacterium]
AGGTVHLSKVGDDPRNYRDTVINDAGEFRFDNLSPGVYMVFTQGAMDGGEPQKFYRPGDSVTLRVKKGGVITGSVTDSTGEPLIAAPVRALRVRDEQGRRLTLPGPFNLWQRERLTDDRGVYRFWGLLPGSYLVSVGGRSRDNGNHILDTTEEGAPTYHPSAATPEAAAEVSVHEGREVTGIDIRHRGESGHAIGGYISGMAASGSKEEAVIVTLTQAATSLVVGQKVIRATDGSSSFVFENTGDGEYDLTAHHIVIPKVDAVSLDVNAVSPNRRVIVKGRDVSGLELKLAPLGSIDGRVVMEAGKQRCHSERNARLDETVIIVNGEGSDALVPILSLFPSNGSGAMVVPDQRGDFTIRSLNAASYRVEAQLPSEDFYIRSVNLPGPTQARPLDAGRDGIVVKPGQRVTGLTITVQEGAASLRGRVIKAEISATLPERLRIYLVPADQQQSDNALRFAEAVVESDGAFLLTNIAPGRYWLLARPPNDLRGDSIRPLAWDREGRAKLVRDAVAADNPIELQPCQRVGDRTLRYAPLATTAPKKMD